MRIIKDKRNYYKAYPMFSCSMSLAKHGGIMGVGRGSGGVPPRLARRACARKARKFAIRPKNTSVIVFSLNLTLTENSNVEKRIESKTKVFF